MMGFADVFAKSQPDILLVLGDRFEIFGAVGAAAVFGIPVAHIHGGELTEGVMDDAFRHSITKMSHIHFAATKEYADRIIQMGEQPDRVFNTGTPAVDAAINAKPVSSDELGVRFGRKNLLITFHPVVLDDMSPSEQFTELLEALTETDAYLIFTYANADMGGAEINEMIEKYVADNSRRSVAVKSFGHQKYISVMKKCDGLVGNSSSGLIEAGALKKGVVNIGIRQRGRVRSANVIDCGNSRQDISQAINMLMSGGFQESLDGCESAYGDGQSADRILYALKTIDLGGINIKKFNDLEQK
jgi:UDP-hydrolysing UDP-N-acetyl-D-glucosamine 2-epimerase